MRKLGLDLGTKTCGFAITDESEIIASALENYRIEENDFDAVIKRVKFYLDQYPNKIDGIVLGHPVRVNGTKSERTVMVEDFKLMLEANFNLPVLLVNEQFTSKKAHQVMIDAGLTRKKRKQHKDKLAALIILQEYLEYYKNRWN
ncbi:Holliday junction resolvase RuvX [Mycoplasma sp. NEAQ87857]|uniref:Holliday junction resolvase RuvX n=1 Tax=Mycoplasma sp. NEAQ87857 TaxID=2683967 RepID=UPI0013185B62|nr:Holliday junction resolvase RuvX [Mycoplasma sp. NEAQ87857]QGZ97772.1 Holliday junction resolvase RuvX [Mycoplasma sp. NEAQ87857]